MKIETIGGALIAMLIGFGTAFLALLNQAGVNGVSDISENAWWVLVIGGLIAFGKDYQSLSTRRFISKLTSTGNEENST